MKLSFSWRLLKVCTMGVMLSFLAQPAQAGMGGFFWWSMAMSKQHQANEADIANESSFARPIAYFSESESGLLDVVNGDKFSVASDTGYLEILLSPVERATFVRGRLHSYTYLHGVKTSHERRAVLTQQNNVRLALGQQSSLSNLNGVFFFAPRANGPCEITEIDGKRVIFFYNDKTMKWDIRIFRVTPML